MPRGGCRDVKGGDVRMPRVWMSECQGSGYRDAKGVDVGMSRGKCQRNVRLCEKALFLLFVILSVARDLYFKPIEIFL